MDLKWIAEMLERPGFSQAGLARALGKDAAAVNRMLKGDRQIKANEVPVILDYLQAAPPPTDRVATLAAQAVGHRPAPAAQIQRVAEGNARPDVPVWASAEAGQDGAMVLVNDPIDYIRRSERMQGVKNPFAFYVIGSSMSPAIEHGDQVVVNPVVPVRPGADCVFIHDDENGNMLALVKRLLRVSADHWRVRQYNPPKDFDLPKKKWGRALLITEKRYG
ncbi:MAG: helix-turn-helix transcriptional regulator [Proteobacteria bacterium]|nr:helix-turn-helix transcriptional regulator [Pseudomonadota bacterium]